MQVDQVLIPILAARTTPQQANTTHDSRNDHSAQRVEDAWILVEPNLRHTDAVRAPADI